MAGDYIKWNHGLERKPKTCAIAASLRIHPIHAAGIIMVFWVWCDTQATIEMADGDDLVLKVPGNPDAIRRMIDRTVTAKTGFSAALESVEWLTVLEGTIVVPGFFLNSGLTAKTRAEERDKKRRQRERDKREKEGLSPGHLGDNRGTCSGTKQPEQRAAESRDREKEENKQQQQPEAEDDGQDPPADRPRVRRPAAALSSLQGDVCSLLLHRVPDLRREDAAAMAREPLADRDKIVWILERYDTERARGWKPDRGWGAWIRGMIRGAQPPPAWMESRRRQQLAEIGARARAAQAAGGTHG